MLSCEPGAVSVDLTPKTRFEWVAAAAADVPNTEVVVTESFELREGPWRRVSIVVVQDGEAGCCRHTVRFRLWATAEARDPKQHPTTTWELVAKAPPADDLYGDGMTLVYSVEEPREAAFQIRAVHPGVLPLVELRYKRDWGGANARNWDQSHVLLDFGKLAPEVTASAHCGYNEGGGACTALSSALMMRSTLNCTWLARKDDARCNEVSSSPSMHRDFYLKSTARPPLSAREVADVPEAARALIAGAPKAQVRDVGWVSIVARLKSALQGETVLLGGGGDFFAIRDLAGKAPRVARSSIRRLPALDDPALASRLDPIVVEAPTGRSSQPSSPEDPFGPWTGDEETSYRLLRTLQKAEGLTVLEVLGTPANRGDEGRMIYWVGIEERPDSSTLDVVETAASFTYPETCEARANDTAIVSIEEIASPFSAMVRVQPETVFDADEEELSWLAESSVGETDCVRHGNLTWVGGHGFAIRIEAPNCKQTDRPKMIEIDQAGRITLKPS